jgi:hypothetical protein
MMPAWRGLLPSALVMMLVSPGRRCRRGSGVPVLTMPRARDFPSPQQLWDQEKRGDKARCATIEHDGV